MAGPFCAPSDRRPASAADRPRRRLLRLRRPSRHLRRASCETGVRGRRNQPQELGAGLLELPQQDSLLRLASPRTAGQTNPAPTRDRDLRPRPRPPNGPACSAQRRLPCQPSPSCSSPRRHANPNGMSAPCQPSPSCSSPLRRGCRIYSRGAGRRQTVCPTTSGRTDFGRTGRGTAIRLRSLARLPPGPHWRERVPSELEHPTHSPMTGGRPDSPSPWFAAAVPAARGLRIRRT